MFAFPFFFLGGGGRGAGYSIGRFESALNHFIDPEPLRRQTAPDLGFRVQGLGFRELVMAGFRAKCFGFKASFCSGCFGFKALFVQVCSWALGCVGFVFRVWDQNTVRIPYPGGGGGVVSP